MRQTFLMTAVVQSLIAFSSQALTLPFEKDTEPFYSSKFQIVWAATNQLAAKVKIFKVVSANFSPTAISNLTAMGGSAVPRQGAMNLYNPVDAHLPLEKVPNRARAYELGTNLLAKLEIPAR